VLDCHQLHCAAGGAPQTPTSQLLSLLLLLPSWLHADSGLVVLLLLVPWLHTGAALLQLASYGHLRCTNPGPCSSYSCFDIHICWKDPSEARMLPPGASNRLRLTGLEPLSLTECWHSHCACCSTLSLA
jgi:hypothetical protein